MDQPKEQQEEQVLAVDQAGAELIYEINKVFFELPGWEPLRHGFARTITKVEIDSFRNAWVVLRPGGWPKPSFISFRSRLVSGWEIFEAQINAPHLGIPSVNYDHGACSWFTLDQIAVGLLAEVKAALAQQESVK